MCDEAQLKDGMRLAGVVGCDFDDIEEYCGSVSVQD